MSENKHLLRVQWWPDGFRLIATALFRGVEVKFSDDGKTDVHYLDGQLKTMPTALRIERIK